MFLKILFIVPCVYALHRIHCKLTTHHHHTQHVLQMSKNTPFPQSWSYDYPFYSSGYLVPFMWFSVFDMAIMLSQCFPLMGFGVPILVFFLFYSFYTRLQHAKKDQEKTPSSYNLKFSSNWTSFYANMFTLQPSLYFLLVHAP